MTRAALFLALSLAPAALGASEFPSWHKPTPGRGAAFAGVAAPRMRTEPRARAATCGVAMQVQSAVQDPPRFCDISIGHALTGVVTRAERQAMMISSRAARLSISPVDTGAVNGPLRSATWETETVGHGVRFRKHFHHNFGQPELHRAVDQIHQATLEALSKPWQHQELVFSAEEVTQVRKVAHTHYIEGQRKLTKLGQLLAARVMSSGYECRSIVTGDTGADSEEFRLSQEVPLQVLNEDLGSLDLAQQQMRGLLVGGKEASIVDHIVEYEALGFNDMAVAKVIAHAQPSPELWRFISDAVFDINWADLGVTAAAEHDSMFEIKILVESSTQADLLHNDMRLISFKDSDLRELHAPVSEESRSVQLVSQTKSQRKSKVVWQGVSMSIQVQTLDEHYMEGELSSMAARAKEQVRREHVCQELEGRVSLFKFSRDLLHWLFASSSMRHPPSTDRIAVKLRQ